MGFLSRTLENRFLMSQDPPEWYIKAQGWWSPEAENHIDPRTAMQVSAVFACIRVLAETVGSLPLILYRRLDDNARERATDHRLYPVLHDLPNSEMTSMELWELLMGHAAGWGNGYGHITFNERTGFVEEIWPLRPDKMEIERKNGELLYRYQMPESTGEGERIFPAGRIMHIRGFGFDGVKGYSPIALHRQGIWLARATETFGANFFENDARPGVVLEHPGQLSPEAQKNLRDSYEERHMGLRKSHKIAILEEGMKVKEVGIPPEDAQYIQTRKFQSNEIARIFRVQPHKIMDMERATFSNIEEQNIEFVVDTIRPWLVRIEQSIKRDLLSREDRRMLFPEFLVDGLLRGDSETRSQFYRSAINSGWMSRNDVRQKENMNPVPELDEYLVPLNMIPATSAGELRSLEFRMKDGEPIYRISPPETENGHRPEVSQREQRAIRSAASRRRLARAHRQLFKDRAARILRREINDIRNKVGDFFNQRDIDALNLWLDQFFEDHREFIKDQMRPVYRAYGEVVIGEAADEIGVDGELTPELERFIDDYVEAYAARHVGSSSGQIRSVAREAEQSGEDPIEALDQRFDEWEERRPDKIADWETYQSNNAIAKAVFFGAGISLLTWRSFGESCPYCTDLDGRTVDITGVFIAEGEEFNPEGADSALRPSTSIGHPPAHGGCDCMVMPVTAG